MNVTSVLSFRLSVLFAAVAGLTLATVPLLAVHGVESALGLGLLLPPWVAATSADYAARGWGTRGIDIMFRAIGAGLVVWAIPTVILALNALRVRQCAPGEGLAFVVLGPGVGCALAASVGVWVGGASNRKRAALFVAGAIPVGAALLGLWAFYATPTVHVFGAFAGYFPGAIYDDLVRLPTRYLTYRATTAVAVVGLAVLFDALWAPDAAALDLRGRARDHAGAIVVATGLLAIAGASYWNGDHLGHWVSKEHLVERLGKTESGRHCIVHMPRETRPEDAERLLSDCDFHVERTRRLTGVRGGGPITAYFFRSQSEKKKLIGIGRTLIAKPWRREIYLQSAPWPDPVLAHEVVHAVLGEVAQGPFAVPGRWGGLIPNPGLVEGAAVALAWDLRDDLDADQWSRIMLDQDELPGASDLMSVRFSGLPQRRAYMAAGSLVRFLVGARGMSSLLDAYATGKIDHLAELEAEWHAYLQTIVVTPRERGVAEVALAQPSIFSAVCPHALAELRADLRGDSAAQDDARMLKTCRAILEIDESEMHARAILAGALARSGDREAALAELDALRESATAPKPLVAAGIEAYADASWTLGRYDEAAALYDELLALPRTDDTQRQSEVKRLALGADAVERALIQRMLIDRPSSVVAMHVAHELSRLREDGLGPYLEARQLVGQSEFALALPLLEEAQRRGLPTLRLERELGRLLGVAYFALGQYPESAAIWQANGWTSRAATARAERWLERIEYAETGSVSPRLEGPSSARRAAP